MNKKYIILSRYEWWSSEGKVWTKWFAYNMTPMTEQEANNAIDEIKSNFGFISQKTKLKHEYTLKDYDEYINERNEIEEHCKEINAKRQEYLKSDEYKELQKKKRQAAKERKERQKKYEMEHKTK